MSSCEAIITFNSVDNAPGSHDIEACGCLRWSVLMLSLMYQSLVHRLLQGDPTPQGPCQVCALVPDIGISSTDSNTSGRAEASKRTCFPSDDKEGALKEEKAVKAVLRDVTSRDLAALGEIRRNFRRRHVTVGVTSASPRTRDRLARMKGSTTGAQLKHFYFGEKIIGPHPPTLLLPPLEELIALPPSLCALQMPPPTQASRVERTRTKPNVTGPRSYAAAVQTRRAETRTMGVQNRCTCPRPSLNTGQPIRSTTGPFLNYQSVEVYVGRTKFLVTNSYLRSNPKQHLQKDELRAMLERPYHILVGDPNAHSPAWGNLKSDWAGQTIEKITLDLG
ncbi:hypothetical protein PoB_004350700 [Plakobranchus ocellatus]|uniref:Endonuclease/exonuclease/phosphatase domain-containing protein n=1 Tax=Plakobranchus ocellatus TaxID=259542 RepID=A0AAV4BC31_9GAST|nr:hypothetical protein PoB_004350700 [Plakobranchus ocellatus]